MISQSGRSDWIRAIEEGRGERRKDHARDEAWRGVTIKRIKSDRVPSLFGGKKRKKEMAGKKSRPQKFVNKREPWIGLRIPRGSDLVPWLLLLSFYSTQYILRLFELILSHPHLSLPLHLQLSHFSHLQNLTTLT
jgi:hypothetical protein